MAETPPPINPAVHNVPEYSVTDIAGAVKRMVEDRFGRVRVRGEISAWKVHSSGHAYFRLKDAGAVLDAVCWRGSVGKIPFKPEDGLEVVAVGKISTYPGKSSYQIVVESMEPAGAGALMALLEKRRAMLTAEGLFDADRKRPLPYMPRVIGVITSPTGAVIRDILHRISERFPAHVIVWPVLVQGEGAAEQIAAAIHGFQTLTPRPDVLIVARGGGSIEDLWAFNEEIVVRAAASAAIPLISAVGHETDTTLIDFASSKRAPTPTAAAEMATPVRDELLLAVRQLGTRLHAAGFRGLEQRAERLRGLSRGLPNPASLLEHATQRLDDRVERLRASLPAALSRKEQKLATLKASFRPQLLLRDVQQQQQRTQDYAQRAGAALARSLTAREDRLRASAKMLEALNYKNVLKRGFALVSAEGKLVTTAQAAQTATSLVVTFHDGNIRVNTTSSS